MRRPDPRRGAVVWLTGLPAAGKTTIASAIAARLEAADAPVDLLDGDLVRRHLSAGLGYSKEDRDTNVLRIAWVASRLARLGAIVVVAAISPYAETRSRARALVERDARFVEVFVDTPLEECVRRDPKGLYASAYVGAIGEFTGVSAPYERPANPDVHVKTVLMQPDEAVEAILAGLAVERGRATNGSVDVQVDPEQDQRPQDRREDR
jgi:adenylyl-sulfate kinase